MKERRLGVIYGPLAILAGISIGHFASTLNKNWHSPVISLANRIVDHVPPAVKTFVIKIFGTNDKLALILIILAVVFAISIAIGRSFLTGNTKVAYLLISLMTLAAIWASLQDAGSNIFSIIPSLISGAVTLAFLYWLATKKELSDESGVSLSRRELLKVVGTIGAVSLVATGAAKLLTQKASVQVDRIKTVLPRPLKFLAKAPRDPALSTPGLSPLFTPNKDFYRIDTAFAVPNVSLNEWKLEITGMVARPRTFTYEQLTARPVFELDDTISCVSNEVGGNLVGNARWLGIRLDDLIREAGPNVDADQVLGYSVDGFTAGFPVAALDNNDAMIAIGMNGEALPLEHGFPARIIVPGLYGYVSATKWLTRIELTRFDQKHGYWISRGWSERGPIKTQSRIDTPQADTNVAPGNMAIAGVAWAPTRGISKVEVRVNKGPWQEAVLGPEIAKTTWRQWWLPWSATKGGYAISVRATDGTGALQPEAYVPVEPNGAEGWHTINVQVS
jgi:DMSO/TMAO reductase YedYZ molybdopterin-dependent catalytic subunit